MRLIRRFIVALVILTAIFVGVGLILPGAVHVQRSTVIAAQPERIFPYLNSPRKFNEWSPWAARDPSTQYAFTGPEEGVGATMTWQSEQMGTGRQEIVVSQPGEKVVTRLEFGSMGSAQASLMLIPEEGKTRVTWTLDSALPFQPLARWFGLAFPWLIGKDYDDGLARLKALAEKGAG
jgi:uncharacterized protein YndB with AHSA1/START domain